MKSKARALNLFLSGVAETDKLIVEYCNPCVPCLVNAHHEAELGSPPPPDVGPLAPPPPPLGIRKNLSIFLLVIKQSHLSTGEIFPSLVSPSQSFNFWPMLMMSTDSAGLHFTDFCFISDIVTTASVRSRSTCPPTAFSSLMLSMSLLTVFLWRGWGFNFTQLKVISIDFFVDNFSRNISLYVAPKSHCTARDMSALTSDDLVPILSPYKLMRSLVSVWEVRVCPR